MTDHLASWFRRRQLHLDAEAMISDAVQATAEDPEDQPHLPHLNLPSTRKASGIPLQIIAAGRPTIGNQRAHWRPDRLADCRSCGSHCHCPDQGTSALVC